ncbi:hypothetical protein ANO11243_052480 [Dothideomycetidae sp. 11243]|nr:hypothetical protein ANO11243_052480 [fungal sp. No.11243]
MPPRWSRRKDSSVPSASGDPANLEARHSIERQALDTDHADHSAMESPQPNVSLPLNGQANPSSAALPSNPSSHANAGASKPLPSSVGRIARGIFDLPTKNSEITDKFSAAFEKFDWEVDFSKPFLVGKCPITGSFVDRSPEKLAAFPGLDEVLLSFDRQLHSKLKGMDDEIAY